MRRLGFFALFLCGTVFLTAHEETPLTIDLCNPVYCDGELSTMDGGVIVGPNHLRLQAQRIIYTYKKDDTWGLTQKVVASGNLILEINNFLFVGDSLEYDFQSKTGTLLCGKTAVSPWFFGGKKIVLCGDGTFYMEEGFITTSESECSSWKLKTRSAHINPCHDLVATDVSYQLGKATLFRLPRLRLNLDAIFDNPVHYDFKWGGREGPRVGFKYEIFAWNSYKVFMRLDYRLTKGPGGGFETYYHSKEHNQRLETINFVARDASLQEPNEKTRYRLQGKYHEEFPSYKTHLDLSWDKLSDRDMATDYYDKGLELDTANRTQLNLWRQERYWTANFLARTRVNDFQTLKQELPTLEASHIPITLPYINVVVENQVKASFLEFDYSEFDYSPTQPYVPDYHSPRVEANPSIYKSIHFAPFTLTPEAGGTFIFYGNSPGGDTRWLAMGRFAGELETTLHSIYNNCKHVTIPYARYEYYNFPTVNPNDHYIFDINDGLYRLNILRCGFRNHFYSREEGGCVRRVLYADVFANMFFDTPTIPSKLPKIYADISWYTSTRTRIVLNTAWDFYERQLDHINIRNEWTFNDATAFSMEYRHRSSYDWRKAQKQNFILDSFRTIEELKDSLLSDHRDTLLLHLFHRFSPNWAFECQSRNGWNRERARPYSEYVFDFQGTLSNAWHIKVAYRHKENDSRIAFYLNVGMSPPDTCQTQYVPWVEF